MCRSPPPHPLASSRRSRGDSRKDGEHEGTRSPRSITWRQCGDGELASQVRAEFTPYLQRGRAKSSPHGQEESAEERGTAASARPRFRSLPTAPRQPPRCLSFHKTNFKVNKAPGTGPLQPLYHPSGVFSFLPPPSRPEPLLFDSIYASCPERDLQGRCLSKAQESWRGPRREGKRKASQKPSDCGFI